MALQTLLHIERKKVVDIRHHLEQHQIILLVFYLLAEKIPFPVEERHTFVIP